MKSNCYLVTNKITQETLIIDPGDDAEYIIRKIRENNLKPLLFIATHGHFDHIMASLTLQAFYKIPFTIQEDDYFLVKQMSSSAKHFLGVDPGMPPLIDTRLDEQKNFLLKKFALIVIQTPGHTPGSICLYSKFNQCLFSGDLIFSDGGLGRYDFSYSDKNKLFSSLKRILKLPLSTVVYPGHGDSFILKREKENFEVI